MIYRSFEQLKEVKLKNRLRIAKKFVVIKNVVIELKISFFRILLHIGKRETGL